MANSDKNILITPATNTSGDPRIVYTPNTAANVITQRLTDSGTISFEGSAGQLFSINNSLTGTLFSVNDVSGIPSIDVADTGLVRISPYNGTLAIGSLAPIQVSSVDSEVSITASSAAQVPLAIRGAASQSADLLQIQNSAGSNNLSVSSTYGLVGRNAGTLSFAISSGAGLAAFYSQAAANVPMMLRGAASQSGSMLELQNSAGSITANFTAPVNNVNRLNLGGTDLSATLGITVHAAGGVGQVIRGAASQSADLQQWQNSAGTVLSEISASGSFYVNTNNNTTGVEFLGTDGTQRITANGNDLSMIPRFDVLFSPATSSGRLRPANDNTSDLGTSGQRWKIVYSSGLSVVNSTAASVVSTIRGAASQSGSLTEWQNSSATRLFSIASTGLPYLSSTSAANVDMYTEAANDMALMLPADDWDDKLRFLYGLYERSTDGSTGWTVNTFDTTIVDGRMDTVMSLPTASLGHRFTWYTTNFQYMTPRYLRLSSGYPGATNSTISVLIESSADNSTWTSRGSYTGISAGIMKRLLRISDNGDHSYVRVTITYTTVSTAMQLENVELLTYRPGNQGGNLAGAESRLPISSWDGNRTSVIQASHSGAVSQIVKGGVVRTATINGAVGNGTTITFTTSTPHVLRVGQSVTITGVNPGAYNISGTIASVTGMSGFTITNAATGTYVSGGTATVTNLANPFEVHNAAGTTVARIDTTGTLVISGIGVTSGDHRVGTSSYFSAALNVLARTTTEKGLVVRGQPSQTANLLEIQNSAGTVVANFDPSGFLSIPNASLRVNTGGTSYGARIQANTDGTGVIGAVIRATSGQTANLQEWQISDGTVKSYVTADGSFLTSSTLTTMGNLRVAGTAATGGGSGVIGIANAGTAPSSSPTGGGILYVNAGALTYRGTSGSARTIVNADGTDPNPLDGTTSTAAAGAGYMGLPQNSTTSGSYTVAAADAGKHLYSSNTRTVTINSNANLALPIGTTVTFISGPFATTTISITSDTMYLAGAGTTGSRTLAAHGIATAVKTTSTTWIISGNGLT